MSDAAARVPVAGATRSHAPLADLTVVVPIGPGDRDWEGLVPQLAAALPDAADVVCVATTAAPTATLPPRVRWLVAPRGRARQLDAGARAARGRWLWFVHADSRLDAATVPALARALASPDAAHALHYFDLAFLADGPALMPLNALGAWLRSRVGGMPFGDQGFCLSRATFDALGGFDVDAPYGEDHLLVWRARRAGVALRPVRARLWTSARRYREQGWLRTTTRHVALTVRQAWPEWRALVRGATRDG
jgi:hypothetical protein